MTWHPDMPDEYKNKIVTGDARELAKRIPDESVDLIFTDPVYQNIEDYRWLAETAARVLKPDRACLAWYGGAHLAQICMAMSDHLRWVWQLNYTVPAKANKLIGYNIFTWTTPCLWFRKGNGFPIERIPDTYIGKRPPANSFKWNKNPAVIARWLTAFAPAGTIILDFFCGSGTVPAVCKMSSRNYIAFEIDPATADLARERVLNTPIPLFILEPEQMELAL